LVDADADGVGDEALINGTISDLGDILSQVVDIPIGEVTLSAGDDTFGLVSSTAPESHSEITLGLSTVTISFEVELSAPTTEPTDTTYGLTLQALGEGGRVWGEYLLVVTVAAGE
jgi:hypothetical protein